jgi:hypothetical protein
MLPRLISWVIGALILALAATSGCTRPSSLQPSDADLRIRGAYGRDSSASGLEIMRSVGLTTVTADPLRSSLDQLARRGMRAIVWLGAYDRAATPPCEFERDDDWIAERIRAIAGHPAIFAYQITDEPNGSIDSCPRVVHQVRARAELISSLDPSSPTYLTVSKAGYHYETWRDVADILGLVIYPLSRRGYDDQMIPTAIEEADRDGVDRYLAVLQDFSTTAWYVTPTPDQLRRQFRQWSMSRMEGYMIYHWRHGDIEGRPGQLDVLADVNGATGRGADPG